MLDKVVFVADIISCISLVFLAIGGIITLIQWKKSSDVKSADYLKEITNDITYSKYVKEGFYILDNSENIWFENVVTGRDEKIVRTIDATLFYYSYICYLKKSKVISNKEFKCFQFFIDTICRNYQVQDYLYYLYFYHLKIKSAMPFEDLLQYAKNNKMLLDGFYKKTLHLDLDKINSNIKYKFHDPDIKWGDDDNG